MYRFRVTVYCENATYAETSYEVEWTGEVALQALSVKEVGSLTEL
jgi:hypothetical protein